MTSIKPFLLGPIVGAILAAVRAPSPRRAPRTCPEDRRSLFCRVVTSVTLALALGACSTRYLPAPRAPERVAPTGVVEASAPREGEGQITLDVVGGPARIDLVTERTQPASGTQVWAVRGRASFTAPGPQITTRPLCVSPCVANLPFGQHELSFTSTDDSSRRSSTGFVTVTPHPAVVRHAMGYQETHAGGVVTAVLLSAFGVAATLAGTALVAIDSQPQAHGLGVAGFTTLGVGAALVTSGIIVGVNSRPDSQPGTTVQWVPSPP
ncbi:MAG: hypothetical protein EPO40_25130 [Myxococcaceae bacterium]|nr:MAG: hypothetical protein EPO40_25130 [Myxococcaceae bacterium]